MPMDADGNLPHLNLLSTAPVIGSTPYALSEAGSVCQAGDIACATRVQIYAQEIYGIPIAGFTMDKLKDAARKHLGLNNANTISDLEREINFLQFERERFFKTDENDPAFWEPLEHPFVSGTNAYKHFKRYAMTDYGARMIRTINNSQAEFTLYQAPNQQAMAQSHHIRLPPDYPRLKTYPYTGQVIDPQATIHHEFEHTAFGSKSYIAGSLREEVAAVIEHENPARIVDGFEPRYVYWQSGTDTTVSVFDYNVTLPGGKTFDEKDPRILK